MTLHKGHPLTMARHEALVSPLPVVECVQAVDPRWLRTRAELFMEASQLPFALTFDLARYSQVTGLTFHAHYAAQVFLGEHDSRLDIPLMAVNLTHVPTREAADRVFAHEVMHLRWPSYGHKRVAFDRAQNVLDMVGTLVA
ncbi:hypothetical protein [Streptomyces canus]|uniref:hypothetical protein n=1 Tax=Streptomyces canus TaxID=58343 RepID=UPI0036E67F12